MFTNDEMMDPRIHHMTCSSRFQSSTANAVLVTTRARAQDVKAVVTGLKESGRDDLT